MTKLKSLSSDNSTGSDYDHNKTVLNILNLTAELIIKSNLCDNDYFQWYYDILLSHNNEQKHELMLTNSDLSIFKDRIYRIKEKIKDETTFLRQQYISRRDYTRTQIVDSDGNIDYKKLDGFINNLSVRLGSIQNHESRGVYFDSVLYRQTQEVYSGIERQLLYSKRANRSHEEVNILEEYYLFLQDFEIFLSLIDELNLTTKYNISQLHQDNWLSFEYLFKHTVSGIVDYLVKLQSEITFKFNSQISDDQSITHLELLASNFTRIFSELQKRRADRNTFDQLDDEYDVQDLLRVLLHVFFNDVRDEEPIQKFGANFSKIDFHLPKEKLFIEVKYATEKNNEKKIKEDLLIDWGAYQKNKEWKLLYCFIFDKYQVIQRPESLINDLNEFTEGSSRRLLVHIIQNNKLIT